MAKGRVKIVVPEQAKTIKNRQRRYRTPKPPPIQTILKRAYELRGHFVTAPRLTRNALAKMEGISPSYLTRILNLLNLAPPIQRYILGLPPRKTKGPITESRLKGIARIKDYREQIEVFKRTLSISIEEADSSKVIDGIGLRSDKHKEVLLSYH